MSIGATAKRSVIVTNGPDDSSRTLNPACGIAAHQPSWRGDPSSALRSRAVRNYTPMVLLLRRGSNDMTGPSPWRRRLWAGPIAALGFARPPVGVTAGAPTMNSTRRVRHALALAA